MGVTFGSKAREPAPVIVVAAEPHPNELFVLILRPTSTTMRCLADCDDIEFDRWFNANVAPRDEDSADRTDALRSWALGLFSTSGPVERDVVAVAYQFDQLAAAESALALVIADLRVVLSSVPTIEVDAYEAGVRITVDGGFSEPSIDVQHPFDVAEIAVEIVEYLREQMSQDGAVSFPKCSEHEDFYLHPVVENGVAVWRCNRGDHVVAPIGRLDTPR